MPPSVGRAVSLTPYFSVRPPERRSADRPQLGRLAASLAFDPAKL
jgi:hypothetical protein